MNPINGQVTEFRIYPPSATDADEALENRYSLVYVSRCTPFDLPDIPKMLASIIRIINRRSVWIHDRFVEVFDAIMSWEIAFELGFIES